MISMVSRAATRVQALARHSLSAMAMLLVAVFVMAGLALPGQAHADPYRYTLSGTMLGAPVSGSFDYDATTVTYSNINITYTAAFAGTVTGGFDRHRADVGFDTGRPGGGHAKW